MSPVVKKETCPLDINAFVLKILEMDYVEQYLKESPFTAKQTPENEVAYERLMDVRLKLVDLSYEIDRNHDAYMRFMQQTLSSPDLKMRIGKVGGHMGS